ncbi:MAG: hypothetical protein JO115_21620 [Pseudonocardiales bacterium]|nr:hypothetical protein [Pseudonocardiales bacterium]
MPLRYLLAFTAVVLVNARDYLARQGRSAEDVEKMHAAWTKAIMLRVTVWTCPYVSPENW